MSEHQEIIQEMLKMQRRFIEIEQSGNFSTAEYYDNDSDSELASYKARYNELAVKLVDLSHQDKGSHR